ncbi:hypothetical protein VHEMI07158 [[Torrubiella] hemipterigena]|uniref:Uncharacterized protein n=1 Tax=[Torrubiella] hemipterigena TaxID=1531966 RepID=A0A0A1TL44_9HYPO|nr:hypothetical protein VHEMI07158 [[Torrubiella] hemipterigena]
MKFAIALTIAAAATGHALSINRQTAEDLELLHQTDGLLIRGEPVVEARGDSNSQCGSQNGSTFCRKERREGNKLIGEATLQKIQGTVNMGSIPMKGIPAAGPRGTMMANSAGELYVGGPQGNSFVGTAAMNKEFKYVIEYQGSSMMFTMEGGKPVQVKM